MKKATIMISTAALMAGTACGVYAESDNYASASFDHEGYYLDGKQYVYEQSVPDMPYTAPIKHKA